MAKAALKGKTKKIEGVVIPTWAVFWIFFSSALVIPDFLYVLLQPHTLPDGKWGGMLPFTIWHQYAEWDRRYSNPQDVFNYVQSILNVVESVLGVGTVLIFGQRSKNGAKLLTAVSIMTFYKTVIYFLMEIVTGMEYIQHNPIPIRVLVGLMSFPWLVVPGMVAYTLLNIA